ncbi:hypothetical protein CLOM_g3731 [Closterium sp. NIES-68]|nr:hypothetical protein CLOM_g3731 [Closterium sp. NIES-68]GJP80934.1 hypothetical protein CLOP_g11129 [Closterium sp. NIES-67]
MTSVTSCRVPCITSALSSQPKGRSFETRSSSQCSVSSLSSSCFGVKIPSGSVRVIGASSRGREPLLVQSAAEPEKFFRDLSDAAQKKAKEASNSASKAFGSAKSKVESFARENDLEKKLKGAAKSAASRLEELSFEAERYATNIDRRYGVKEKANELLGGAVNQLREVDEKLRVRQRFRAVSQDLKQKWPKYERQLNEFKETPIGQAVFFGAFCWLLLSGWLFQLFFWSLWLIPLLPWIVRSMAGNAIVEGVCPSCGQRFVGPRAQVLACQRCRGVVWNPNINGQASKGGRASRDDNIRIIDIEAE